MSPYRWRLHVDTDSLHLPLQQITFCCFCEKIHFSLKETEVGITRERDREILHLFQPPRADQMPDPFWVTCADQRPGLSRQGCRVRGNSVLYLIYSARTGSTACIFSRTVSVTLVYTSSNASPGWPPTFPGVSSSNSCKGGGCLDFEIKLSATSRSCKVLHPDLSLSWASPEIQVSLQHRILTLPPANSRAAL